MTVSVELSSSVMTLFQLIHTNVFAFDTSGTMLTLHTPHPIPDTLNQAAFPALIRAVDAQPDKCHSWHSDFLVYMAASYDKQTVVIAGPFLTQLPAEEAGLLNKHALRSLPILNQATQQSVARLLMHLNQMKAVQISSLETEEPVPSNVIAGEDEATIAIINLRYELSNHLMHAIENGDVETLKSVGQKTGNLFDFSARFPNKPLRALKNSLIILNTSYRLAAERGGVPPVLLHQLSEKFAIAIERINSLQALDQLQETMGMEYCQLVLANQLSGYSMLIKKAIRYLHVHFTEPFDAAALSDELNVHPSHLARQFKKETGTTMNQFVHQLRIQKAKQLLKKDLASIEYIAGECGFEDAAYFIRVFKKWSGGMPPGKWRSHGSD